MKELTSDQIQELHRLVERNAIGHYDVKLEIVDHYASAIETIWAKDPNVSFYQAQLSVYKDFWDFKGLVEDKRMTLYKQAKKETWIQIKAMSGWYDVLELIALFPLVYSACSYLFEWIEPIYFFPIIMLLPLILKSYFGFNHLKAQKELGHPFLKIEAILTTNFFLPSVLYGILLPSPFTGLLESRWGLVLFTICLVLYILIEKVMGKILDKEIQLLKKQFSKT